MKTEYAVKTGHLNVIEGMPNGWTENDCRSILQFCEFDFSEDIASNELEEYVVICLQGMSSQEVTELFQCHGIQSSLN